LELLRGVGAEQTLVGDGAASRLDDDLTRLVLRGKVAGALRRLLARRIASARLGFAVLVHPPLAVFPRTHAIDMTPQHLTSAACAFCFYGGNVLGQSRVPPGNSPVAAALCWVSVRENPDPRQGKPASSRALAIFCRLAVAG